MRVRTTSGSVVGEGLSAEVTFELSSDEEEEPGMADWDDEMELHCWQRARPMQSLKEGQRAECG